MSARVIGSSIRLGRGFLSPRCRSRSRNIATRPAASRRATMIDLRCAWRRPSTTLQRNWNSQLCVVLEDLRERDGRDAKHRHRRHRARGVDVAAVFGEPEEVGVKPKPGDAPLAAGQFLVRHHHAAAVDEHRVGRIAFTVDDVSRAGVAAGSRRWPVSAARAASAAVVPVPPRTAARRAASAATDRAARAAAARGEFWTPGTGAADAPSISAMDDA